MLSEKKTLENLSIVKNIHLSNISKYIHLSKSNLSELIKPWPFYPNNTRTSAPYRNLHVFTGVLIIDDIILSKTE